MRSTMTRKEYLLALKMLGLGVAEQRTARMLGLTVRQIQNFADGTCPIPQRTALLLRMYITTQGGGNER